MGFVSGFVWERQYMHRDRSKHEMLIQEFSMFLNIDRF